MLKQRYILAISKLSSTLGGAWSGHPDAAAASPACAAGNATTVHAGDRYEELEPLEAKKGSTEIPLQNAAVMAARTGKGTASAMDLKSDRKHWLLWTSHAHPHRRNLPTVI